MSDETLCNLFFAESFENHASIQVLTQQFEYFLNGNERFARIFKLCLKIHKAL